MKIVPFFVADRPMSLRLLKSLPLQKYPDVRIGIMAHANTTLNFQNIFNSYPCDDMDHCEAVGGPCQFKDNIFACSARQHILQHTVKMCDSGIFTREGAMLNYKQLYEAYVRMGVEYGIIIDVFRDPPATLKSAREALQAYENFEGQFKLVGVAQGQSVIEYVQNYEALKALGFTHVAIGGLLRKLENTARYAHVRDEEIMDEVLGTLRERYPEDWLFALGCFNPSRLDKFKKFNAWGDYKGWIFQYEKRNETLDGLLEVFASNHLQHIEVNNHTAIDNLISSMQEKVKARNILLEQQKTTSQQLFEGRRTLKTIWIDLYRKAQASDPEAAEKLKNWTTRGLLSDREEKELVETLQHLRIYDTSQEPDLLSIFHKNRGLKAQIASMEQQLNGINSSLVKDITTLQVSEVQLSEDTESFFAEIAGLIKNSERSHRFEQVRDNVEQKILIFL